MEVQYSVHPEYLLTPSDYRAVTKAPDKDSIGNIFIKLLHKFLALFGEHHRDQALGFAHDFHNESLPAEERLAAFLHLKEMAGHGKSDIFKLETKNGQVHAHIDLDGEIKSSTLAIGYNEFVKIQTKDWFLPTKTLEAETVLDTFLAHSTPQDIKLSSYEKLMRWIRPEYQNNFIHASNEKSSFHTLNLDQEGVVNPQLSYISFNVGIDKMQSILNANGTGDEREKLFNVDAPRTNFIVNGQEIPSQSMELEKIKQLLNGSFSKKTCNRLIKTCNQNTENSLIMGHVTQKGTEKITGFHGHNGEEIDMINFPGQCSTSYTSIEGKKGHDVKVKIFRDYDVARVDPSIYAMLAQASSENKIYTSLTQNIEFTIKYGKGGSAKVNIDKIEVKAGYAPRNDFIDENFIAQ